MQLRVQFVSWKSIGLAAGRQRDDNGTKCAVPQAAASMFESLDTAGLRLFCCVPSSKLGTLWEGDRGFVTCPSVCLSVRLSVAKRSAQTAHWSLIKSGVNMHEDVGMPPLYSFFLGQRSRSRETIYYHDPLCLQRKHARHFVRYVGHFWTDLYEIW